MGRKTTTLHTRQGATKIALLLCLLCLAACANIGSPDGGRYDEEPPRVVWSSPNNKAVDQQGRKIKIAFNEYIKLESASEKVVISPPQEEQPNVRAVNKTVRVDLYDTLRPNTTYTIDFADAIVDNNESNPMGKYTFSFSTGPEIDTMEVSGTVLSAENLEPVKGILVGLHPLDSLFDDSLFTTQPLSRVGRTNGSGQFTIKGVKDGRYRAFALMDMDNNYAFTQKAETIAWDTITLTTSQRPDLRPDTVWRDTITIEKIRMVPYIHYFPDDVVLLSFLEAGQDKHLLKTTRERPESFTLFFTAPQDSLPSIVGFYFDADKCLVPEPTEGKDTIVYWITDTCVAYADTLRFALTYLDTDTAGIDLPRTDTLELIPKTSHEKIAQQRQKQIDDWDKEREKKIKRAKEPLPFEQNPYVQRFLEMKTRPGTSIAPNQNITLQWSEPIAAYDSLKVHFRMKVDTLFVDEPFLLEPSERNAREFTLYAEWQSGAAYKLELDSAAFVSHMQTPSKASSTDIKVRTDDEFGSIFVKLVGTDEHCIVQLLDKSDKPVTEAEADESGRANFFYLKPQDYYLRLYIDRNQNGQWDTGEYATQTPPEEVFYFPKAIPLRAKFDVEQSWDYRSIPRTEQKPKEITKQKADKEKSVKNRNQQRDEEKAKQKKKK